MPNKKYQFEPLEVAGNFAMFSNPCGGSQLSSYPFPTITAAKGMIESVLFMPQVKVSITKIHICKPVSFERFGFNASVSHLRKDSQKTGETSLQRRFSALSDVVYQIYGYVENLSREDISGIKIPEKYTNTNHAHAWQEIYNRRLKRGALSHPINLGKRMFPASYCGPVRKDEKGKALFSPCEEVNLTVPSMPLCWFDKLQLGTKVSPSFIQDVKANMGVVVFDDNLESNRIADKGDLIHA